ncbi:MAG: 4Fe-4S dicluster domain-containing protein [Pseudomonadota bacterium]
MATRKPREEFNPSEEQMALWPEVSGNTVNGLGESKPRRPSPVMWHDPDMIPHGEVQTWFWEQGRKEPELFALREDRQRVIDRPEPPVAARIRNIEPNAATQKVKELAMAAGADLVGIVRPRHEWIFEGYDFDYSWIVMLGVAMDHTQLMQAPEVPSAVEVVKKYTKGWAVARPISDWVRSQGWRATPRGGPEAGPVLLVPAAIEAGFGELGKHGSIINAELGSCFRLAAIFTDLPLCEDHAVDIAAEDFCTNCRVCVEACPPQAIRHDKQTVRGEEKWYVDFDKCFPYFAETYGCGICLAVCPWSKPGRGPLLSQKMMRRRANKSG